MFYPEQIPAFVEHGLDKLYQALFASLPQLQLTDMADISTYAARHRGKLSAIFLYRRRGRRLRVVNEGMHLHAEELDRFATNAFRRYPELRVLHFHAVDVTPGDLPWPALHFAATEDIVILLPDSEEAYLAQLGKTRRKALRQHQSRAERACGPLEHRVLRGDEISVSVVDRIIAFNHARMAVRHRASALDERVRAQLLYLLRARGEVGLLLAGGRLCAGALTYRIGTHVYSLVNAHDPEFDEFSMGTLCRLHMISAAINSGVTHFHLLGGQWSTKRHAGATCQRLDHWVIYRSRRAMLLDTVTLARLTWQAAVYRSRHWAEVQRTRTRPSRLWHLVQWLASATRSGRRAAGGR